MNAGLVHGINKVSSFEIFLSKDPHGPVLCVLPISTVSLFTSIMKVPAIAPILSAGSNLFARQTLSVPQTALRLHLAPIDSLGEFWRKSNSHSVHLRSRIMLVSEKDDAELSITVDKTHIFF